MQVDALVKYGVPRDRIYHDVMSGTKADRPGLKAAIKACRKGDALVVWKLDRLGRSLTNVLKTLELLDKSGVRLCSLTESLDARTPMGKAMFHMLLVIAQLERDLISERTKAGLAVARARGAMIGRQKVMTAEMIALARSMLQEDPPKSKAKIAAACGVSAGTIYNWLNAERAYREIAADPLDDNI